MERQPGFSELEFAGKRRITRREKFLAAMDEVVPWDDLLAATKPAYPDGQARPPAHRARTHAAPLLPPAMVWPRRRSPRRRRLRQPGHASFLGINLSTDPVPDATTLLKFRRLLEKNGLCAAIFETINAHLEERGLPMREGTLVDATIINAPSSTKNRDKARDPGMHRTKKGNQWYFGMKAHIGADRHSSLVHTVVSTAANVSDISQAGGLLHGSETQVHADAGYVGVGKRDEIKAADPEGKLDWQIAKRRQPIRDMEGGPEKESLLAMEKAKASVRAFAEHPFHILKNIFKHRKTRYRGLAKNHHQLQVLFGLGLGLGNLVVAARQAA